MKKTVLSLAVAGIVFCGLMCAAHAGFVTVGNPGNAADTTSYGSVAYEYQISEYEVTAGEWRDFLNVVDPAGANALGLYNSLMDSNSFGCQITWNTGESTYDFSGGTTEAPGSTAADWQNRPVNYVSWYDAARYTNWLTTGDTESGVYNTSTWEALPHATAATTLGVPVAYFIPTEDEWYKAAYHKNDGVTENYWDYPTKSDVPNTPGRDMDEATNPGNNANYYTTSYLLGSPPYYRTEVGEFQLSTSPYGTFDQGGNVWEWNETQIAANRGVRGGSFGSFGGYYLQSDVRYFGAPTFEFDSVGFRVASITGVIPEPGSVALLALGAGMAVAVRRRTRRQSRNG